MPESNPLTTWYTRLGWLKRQILLIAAVLVCGWIASGILIAAYHDQVLGHSAKDAVPHIFAAWLGELAFFSIIGGLITVISLRNPMDDPFHERLKIVFGHNNVPNCVLNYNKQAFTRLSVYAKTVERTLCLEQYLPEIAAYRARVTTTYDMHNLLHDVELQDVMSISVTPDKFPDKCSEELGRLTSAKIGDRELVSQPLLLTADGLSTEFPFKLPPGGNTRCSTTLVILLKCGELQNFASKRVVELFEMDLVSQCDCIPRIEINNEIRTLIYNTPVKFIEQAIEPQKSLGVFRPLSPQ